LARLIEAAAMARQDVPNDVVQFLAKYITSQLADNTADARRIACLALRPLLAVEVH
jgi:hypothetical protein